MPRNRRPPRRAIRASQIPTAGSFSGTVIVSGTIDPAVLGTGVRDGTKYLRDDGSWQAVAGGGGSALSRADLTFTTASLANDAAETGTANLGKSFIPLRVTVDRPCRVQFYQTGAARTADAARPAGSDPTGEHGVILDCVFVTGNLVLDIIDPPAGFCGEAVVSDAIPYRVTNQSGAASTVQVTVNRIILETA